MFKLSKLRNFRHTSELKTEKNSGSHPASGTKSFLKQILTAGDFHYSGLQLCQCFFEE